MQVVELVLSLFCVPDSWVSCLTLVLTCIHTDFWDLNALPVSRPFLCSLFPCSAFPVTKTSCPHPVLLVAPAEAFLSLLAPRFPL